MIHLIWSIINGIIVIYFLYLIIGFILKGKKIFKPKFKVVSIFIIVIGIVQIISASDSEKNANQISITKDYNRKNNSEIKQVKLEDNWTFDINMIVKYSIEQDEYIPIESDSLLTGLVSWNSQLSLLRNFCISLNQYVESFLWHLIVIVTLAKVLI